LQGDAPMSYWEIARFDKASAGTWDETDDYTYDPNGNLTKTVRNGSESWQSVYDALNRVTSVTDSAGRTIQYQYDAAGRKTGMVYPDGLQVSYVYDNANRLTAIQEGANTLVTYAYDAANRLINRILGNGVRTDYTYDDANQLTLLTTSLNGNPLARYSYTYDNLGNRLSKTDLLGTSQYSYDAISQLTAVTEPGSGQRTYGYDAVNNRVQ